MRSDRRLAGMLLAGTMLAGVAAPALAQSAPGASGKTEAANVTSQSPEPGSAGAEDASADIIVTATKRSESLQKVPISIQALTPAVLEQHQVSSFDDYVKLLPSVSYQSFGPSQSQLYFRGITTGGDGLHAGPLPTTGLYIDEVPVTTIGGSVDIHAYDLARVEALAGPQGTLYGASSLSGTLRLIANKPDATKFEAGYDAQGTKYGDGDFGGEFEGFVNIPLGERVAARVVGFYQRDGGYIDNTFNRRTYQRPHTVGTDENGDPIIENSPFTIDNEKFAEKNFNDIETYGGRAALKIDLDDNWTLLPQVIAQHQVSGGTFLYDPHAGDLEVHDFTRDHHLDKWYLASLTVQGKLSDWDVTYAGSYFQRTVEYFQDYSYFNVAYDTYADYNYYKDANGKDIDPTQTLHGHDAYTKMSHELRVSSPADRPLRLTAGMFLQRQTDNQTFDYILPGLPQAVNPFSPPIPGAPPQDVYYTNIHRVDRDYAAFTELSYDLLPNLTVTGGVRGFIAKNTLFGFSGGIGGLTHFPECVAQTVQACPNINKKYNESGETHKANLSWRVTPDKMVYATYSTGFRPGGNNRNAFALGKEQNIPPFAADTITNYEVGFKTTWLNRTLRANGAFFWEDWDKVQYSLPGILGIYYTVNAGRARSRGVEGDVSWLIAGHLTLGVGGTYVDAKLRQNFVGVDGTVLAPAGTRLPITPKLKLTGTARYDFALADHKSFLQAAVNHQSGTTQFLTTDGEDIIGPTKGFTTFDFSAGTRFGSFSVSAFIQNAFDKRGILSKNSVCTPGICGPYLRLYPIKPQFFGVKVAQRF